MAGNDGRDGRGQHEPARDGRETNQEELKQLIERSSDPIFVWDFDGGILDWNRGSEELYGYTAMKRSARGSNNCLARRYRFLVRGVEGEAVAGGQLGRRVAAENQGRT